MVKESKKRASSSSKAKDDMTLQESADSQPTSDNSATAETASNGETSKETGVSTTIVDTDRAGNRFLPGTEIEMKTIPELEAKALEVKTKLTPPFQAAQKALSVGKTELDGLCHKYLEYFEDTGEELVYSGAEVEIRIAKKETIKVTLKDEE